VTPVTCGVSPRAQAASTGRAFDRGNRFVIREDLTAALHGAVGALGLPDPGEITLDVPRQRAHGDWSANVAMRVAKTAGRAPRDVAADLVGALEAMRLRHVSGIDIAGPGFINFRLAPGWLHDLAAEILVVGPAYGHSTALAGRRINLEFVSANPTGPLHAGGGRWVATGDAIANLLAAQGAEVHREYYLNDTGSQLDNLRTSLAARYHGREVPEDGYPGPYVIDIAADARAVHGDDLDDDALLEFGLARIINGIRDDLARVGVHFDTWFSEQTLHTRGRVADVLGRLRAAGHTYEKDGAEWLRTEDFGDDRDRVLVKSDGSTTYLCNDLAYHRDKFERGFTHLIDIWGADHHGQVKSIRAGIEALTGRSDEPEIILGQLVTLLRDGQQVRIGKRSGTFVALADILDEVDADVTRMTFLLQSLDTRQTFDLAIVTAQSMENPVYYVQMAHARIASIARRAAERGVERVALDGADLGLLTHERELEVLRQLAVYPDAVADAAASRAPHKVAHWAHEFAGAFHGWYHDCRVLDQDPPLTQARLWFTEVCRIVLANALKLLGVGAPDEMARLEETE
jgi:arginyl-tRNA synthetase